jgi:hypothetical protein
MFSSSQRSVEPNRYQKHLQTRFSRLRPIFICAQFVPEDFGCGDLSDSADSEINNLRIINTRLRFDPTSRHHA